MTLESSAAYFVSGSHSRYSVISLNNEFRQHIRSLYAFHEIRIKTTQYAHDNGRRGSKSDSIECAVCILIYIVQNSEIIFSGVEYFRIMTFMGDGWKFSRIS